MDTWTYLFSKVDNPDSLQMVCRGACTFLAALVIIRVGARRSLGKGTAVDNILVIMLGGMLGRVVTGAVAFLPVMAATAGVVLLHRLISGANMNHKIAHIVMGKNLELYANGMYNGKNMSRTMTGKEDLEEAIRLEINTDDFTMVDKIFMERNGRISVLKKSDK